MVLRFLLRFLLSDKVVNKLSESYPIRRAAKWVVYFMHKANAIKGDQKISINQDNLKSFQKVSERLISFWQQRFKSIKPESYTSVKKQNQARYNTSDAVNKNEINNPSSNSKQSETQAKFVEEGIKKYIEELKKRSQQQ